MNIDGTAGADYLAGTAQADVIRTFAGGDVVMLTAGQDSIDLGTCYDVITFNFYELEAIRTRTSITITDARVSESSGLFNSSLISAESFSLGLPTMDAFTLNGTAFNGDISIQYEGGAHQIVTGAGDDYFSVDRFGGGSFDGGAGYDTYAVDEAAPGHVVVTDTQVKVGTLTEAIANVESVSLDDENYGSTPYTIDASAFSGGVELFLSKGGNTIVGGKGDDYVEIEDGLGGNTINTGTGQDFVSLSLYAAEATRIVVTEDAGVLTIGGVGQLTDTLRGVETIGISIGTEEGAPVEIDASDLTAAKSATLSAYSAAKLTGGAGDDTLYGSNDADRLIGGAGVDTLWGGQGRDTLTGGAGVDIYSAYNTADLSGDLYADMAVGERILLYGVDESRGQLTLTQSGKVVTLSDGTRFSLGLDNVRLVVERTEQTVTSECAADQVVVSYALVARAGNGTGGGGAVPHDIDGDGRSDVVWRNDNGALTNWFAKGNGFDGASGFSYQVAREWSVAGGGDFNGDGREDLLWRHADGRVTSWNASGNGYDGTTGVILDPGVAWKIAGVGDFNGDGRDDILWRNDNGLLTDWLGNGTGFNGAGRAAYSVAADWKVAGIGDFDGDGRDDMLWRNDNGLTTTWSASANGFVASPVTLRVGAEWKAAGVADFNGDGRDDILWRNDAGTITDWYATAGGGFTPNSFAVNLPNSWQVEANGDYNGDGRADILWRNADGQVATWVSDGNGFTPNAAAGGVVPNDWHIVL